jgi:cytochrome c oxidase accessory protein FixG
VLLDEDSLVVGYDAKRGEPRGKKGHTDGDCVDCGRCVVVCPTGIDIRDGLQLDCLACTACIDACDDVMDRLDRPRGLIRYDSPNGLAGKPRRILRPRIALYTALLAAGGVAAILATRARSDFEAVVSRLPGPPYTVEAGTIRNAFDVHVVNKRGERATFDLTLEAPRGIDAVIPVAHVSLDGLEGTHVPLFVTMPQPAFQGDARIRVRVARAATTDAVVTDVTFLGARSR